MKNGIVRFQFFRFVPLHPGVYPRRKLTCFPVGGPFEPLPQPAQSPRILQPRKLNSTKEYVRIYKLFMQNKPNFRNDKMNITMDMTIVYRVLSAGSGQKTKPKQTQFKANKAKNKANLTKGQK